MPDRTTFCGNVEMGSVLGLSTSLEKVSYSGRESVLYRHLSLSVGGGIGALSLNGHGGINVIYTLRRGPQLCVLSRSADNLSPLVRGRFFGVLGREGRRNTAMFLSSRVLSRISHRYGATTVVQDNQLVAYSDITDLSRDSIGEIALGNVHRVSRGSFVHSIGVGSSRVDFLCDKGISHLVGSLSTLDFGSVAIAGPSLSRVFVRCCRGTNR